MERVILLLLKRTSFAAAELKRRVVQMETAVPCSSRWERACFTLADQDSSFFSHFPFKQTNLCSWGATDVHLFGSPSSLFFFAVASEVLSVQLDGIESISGSLIEREINICVFFWCN